jgi:hypothetical protein
MNGAITSGTSSVHALAVPMEFRVQGLEFRVQGTYMGVKGLGLKGSD